MYGGRVSNGSVPVVVCGVTPPATLLTVRGASRSNRAEKCVRSVAEMRAHCIRIRTASAQTSVFPMEMIPSPHFPCGHSAHPAGAKRRPRGWRGGARDAHLFPLKHLRKSRRLATSPEATGGHELDAKPPIFSQTASNQNPICSQVAPNLLLIYSLSAPNLPSTCSLPLCGQSAPDPTPICS